MASFHLRIEGKPVPQERAGRHGFRSYDPPKSKAAKTVIIYAAKAEIAKRGWQLSGKPISITAQFWGAHGKADIDNLYKLATDALSGLIWKDDRQIVAAYISKLGLAGLMEAHTSIWITEVDHA